MPPPPPPSSSSPSSPSSSTTWPTDWPPAGDNDDASPTHNKPWPLVDPFMQGRFERKYLADEATIDFDTLPRLQSWMSLLGRPDNLRVFGVLRKLSIHSKRAERPLTGPEANALSEHAVGSLRYASWIHPISLGITTAATLAGAKTFKFPFYQPKMIKFKPHFFPSRRLPLLRGPWAFAAWQFTRLAAYAPTVWIPTAFFFASISENTFEAHVLRDPRLANLVKDIRRNITNKRNAAQQQLKHRIGTQSPMEQVPAQQGAEEGASPRFYEGADYGAPPSGAFDNSSMATRAAQSTQPAPRWTQENTLPSSSSHRDDDDNLFDDDDDDASPVAPSARRARVGKGPSSSSGSSWDRIRQQAKSGSPDWEAGDSSGQERGWAQLRQDKTRNPSDSKPQTDSYSYSNNDEKRERRDYEKEQAQKEFDALVEAERRGDGSSNSNRDRWK